MPLALMAALLFLAWWRNSRVVAASYHGFADAPHPLLHDGVIAGLIGASAIAVWFLVIDPLTQPVEPFNTHSHTTGADVDLSGVPVARRVRRLRAERGNCRHLRQFPE